MQFEPARLIWHNSGHGTIGQLRMLLQTNSYIVPKDKRAQHTRLVQRFRQTLTRLGCDHFEAYEQVGANWNPADTTGRFVQLMRFHDRKHQLAVQAAERNDPTAQGLIKEFCELINFPYQQQQGLFAVGFYHSLLPTITPRQPGRAPAAGTQPVAPPDIPADAAQENGEVEESEPSIEETADAQPPAQGGGEAVDETADRSGDIAELSIVSDDAAFEPFEGELADTEALIQEMESSEGTGESHTAEFHSGRSEVEE